MSTSLIRHRLLKAAAGDQQTFETSLASIGRAVIASRAPSISKNEIGFQVLDSDDDNTRAVGVFGYKIGGRLYYVPMFYRDGVTKGVEQLRDPKRKRTVPLSDNWVNKLTIERGDDEPKRVERSKTRATSQPSLWQLKYPPTKWAHDELGAVMSDLSTALVHGGQMADTFEAPDLLKEAAEHPELMTGLQEWVRLYPWFGQALLKCHGAEKMAAAIARAETVAVERARPRPRTKWAYDRPKLVIMRVSQVSLSAAPSSRIGDFDPADLGELRAGRNAYVDKRSDEDVARIESRWDGTGSGVLANPDEPGVRPVLGADMKFHTCAVLHPLVAWDPCPGDCLVIRCSDGAWTRSDRNAVWVMNNVGVDLEAGVEWHAKLKDGKNVSTENRVAAIFLAPGKHLHASVPFRVGEDGEVWGGYGGGNRRSYWAEAGSTREHDPGREDYDCPRRARLSETAARMVVASNCLYMPERSTRFAELGYEKEKLKLAVGDDPEQFLVGTFKAASEGLDTLTVRAHRNGSFAVIGKRGSAEFGRQADAEAYLVDTHALRVPAARGMVESAVQFGSAHAALTYPTKRADDDTGGPYRLPTNWPNAPIVDDPSYNMPASFADDILPTETSASNAITMTDMAEQPGSTERYRPYPVEYGTQVPLPGIGNSGDGGSGPSGDDVKTVAEAARSGSKELFDTAALAALVKRTRLDAVIEKVTKASEKWMNASADALSHLYWNTDDWSDRFGQGEIGPLEDQLRDHFEGVGDLLLSLQEKTVDGGRDFGLLPNLDNVDAASSAGGR